MEKKITKAEMFGMIKAVPAVAENEEMVAFIDHELDLLAKKSANKKPNKNQVANESLKAQIVDVLKGESLTATEVLKALDDTDLTVQKVSSLLSQLVKSGEVEKTTDKKKSYFTVTE